MIDPKDVTITDHWGNEHVYRIGRIPYMDGGREICTQFISTATPRIGDYTENQRLAEMMFKNISVVLEDGREINLTTRALVNNHVPDFLTGIKLEEEMISHNLGFSLAGKVREFQQDFSSNLMQWVTKILTPSRAASSAPEPPPSES